MQQELIAIPNAEIIKPKRLLYYLAHPYTHKGHATITNNVIASVHYTNELLDRGYFVFNPLTHSHRLDQQKSRPASFWYEFDLKILERCDGIIMSGNWRESKGCMLEYDLAKSLGLVVKEYAEVVR